MFGRRPSTVPFQVVGFDVCTSIVCPFVRTIVVSRHPVRLDDSYLVDPASSHMLVSKIKPCMSKYKLLYTVKLRMAH